MTAMLMLLFVPTHLKAETKKDEAAVSITKTDEPADADALVIRLNDIKAMDKTGLTSIEKRELRREVRSIEATLNEMGGGVVVISAGSLLIIILLIIILL